MTSPPTSQLLPRSPARTPPAHRPPPATAARAAWVTSSAAPLSARICATWARLSTGLIGTCTSAGARQRPSAARRQGASWAATTPRRPRSPGLAAASHAATDPVSASSPTKSIVPGLVDQRRRRRRLLAPARYRSAAVRDRAGSCPLIRTAQARCQGLHLASLRPFSNGREPTGAETGVNSASLTTYAEIDTAVRAVLRDVLGLSEGARRRLPQRNAVVRRPAGTRFNGRGRHAHRTGGAPRYPDRG